MTHFAFGPWYFILVPAKLSPNLFFLFHFNPYFDGLKSNILHITRTNFNMN
jgi:hypothetical protein